MEVKTQRQLKNFEDAVKCEMDRGFSEEEARRYWGGVRNKHPEKFDY